MKPEGLRETPWMPTHRILAHSLPGLFWWGHDPKVWRTRSSSEANVCLKTPTPFLNLFISFHCSDILASGPYPDPWGAPPLPSNKASCEALLPRRGRGVCEQVEGRELWGSGLTWGGEPGPPKSQFLLLACGAELCFVFSNSFTNFAQKLPKMWGTKFRSPRPRPHLPLH